MKQIGKKLLAIMLTTAMVLQVVSGFIPTAKQVNAETSEPNYLDVVYDFTKMTDDELKSSELTAAKYNSKRSDTPYTRWRDGNDVQAGELWKISNDRLQPAGDPYVKLHVAEERDTFQFTFEAKEGTQYGYGIDIGITDRFGYGGAGDSAVFGFVVDGEKDIEIHGFATNSMKINDKISSALSSAGTMKTNVTIPKNVVTKWTVTKNGNTVVVSEEVTGIEFSVALHSDHQLGKISLNATGSGRFFSKASVDYIDTYYDFTKMTDDELDSSELKAAKYNSKRSGTPYTRWRDGNDVQAGELWNISNGRLQPAGDPYVKLHVEEESDTFQFKFEAKGASGYGYGIDIGLTDRFGYGGAGDSAVFGFIVDGKNAIEIHGFADNSIQTNDKISTKPSSAGAMKTSIEIPINVVTKWTVTKNGNTVVVSEEVTGIEFSVTLHSDHQTGKISLNATGSGRLFSKASVDVPVVVPEEPDAEGTYTFTKKMYQNNLEASGIMADRYQVSGLSSEQVSRPSITNENETADDLWVVSTDKGLTPKNTVERQFLKAHIAEEREAFELKFEAYGSNYGFSIGTTEFMGNNNAAPQDPYTAEINVSGNNIELSGVDEDTLDIISNGEYSSTDGGIVRATSSISSDSAKWIITVFGMDITVKEETSGVEFSVRMNAEHIAGKISLRTTANAGQLSGFYSARVTYQGVDSNLIMFDNLSLSDLQGWTSRIYNENTGEVIPAQDITEQWFTGEKYTDNVEDWNPIFNPRNNPGLKPRVLTDETTPYILTNTEKDYENFESYVTYYQHSVRYAMIIGDKTEYPTTIADSAVYVYIHGSSSGYELRVTGAVDLESAVVTGAEGTILRSADTARLALKDYGFSPEGASAYKTTTIHVKVKDGVLTASVDDIEAAIQVNLASTYVHGGISLVSTGSAHGGFKYLYVKELESTDAPADGAVNYDMVSKNEYAVVSVGTNVPYSSLEADFKFDAEKYEYIKAVFKDDNYRMNDTEFGVLNDTVKVKAYTNQSDSYVDLYFKTKDGEQAKDFGGFQVTSAAMKVVGGKEVASLDDSVLALEYDYDGNKVMSVADLVSTDNADNRTALRSVLLGKETVSPLFGMSALFLGDSIMNAVIDDLGWYGRLASYGMDCEEVAQDGWALTSEANRGRIISQFQYVTEGKDFDFVLLEGAVNDILLMLDDNELNITWGEINTDLTVTEYETTTIAGAMQELVAETQKRYDDAQIVYVINSEFGGSSQMQKYVQLVKDVCDLHGISYVNLSNIDLEGTIETYPELEVINNKQGENFRDYMVDNIHPNAKSYDLTTPYVAAKLQEILLANQSKAYVYVDAGLGNDKNDGSKEQPFKTMSYAATRVDTNGTIEVVGTYDFTEEASLGNASKAITVTGGTLDISEVAEFNLKGDVTLTSLTVKANDEGKIYANGNRFVVNETVAFDGRQGEVYGGANQKSVNSTYLVLNSGNFRNVYGGGVLAKVDTDVYVLVGGNFNKGVDVFANDHELSGVYNIFGGSVNHDVLGNTEIVIDGKDAVVGSVYAGSYGASGGVKHTSKVTLKNGTVYSLYGAGYNSAGYTNTRAEVYVEGGKVAQIFGGAIGSGMTGSTHVEVKGGTVTRRIYGGCYNEYATSLQDFGWQSDYFVNGTTTVILHDEATYLSQENDDAICASSRREDNASQEQATLEFETRALYDSCEDRLNVVMTSDKGYDTLIVAEDTIVP